MNTLATHPIAQKWPPRFPDRLQLYTLATPNGVKISIALEETGLPYEAHRVSFDSNDQYSPEFHALNPNERIPAIIDPQGPGKEPLPLFESGAILIYIAEKAGQLLPADPIGRYQCIQWLMFQMSGVGPIFGQVGFFNRFAGRDWPDKRPLERYVTESRRLLAVLEERLDGRPWIMGEQYTIADIAIFPWVNHLVGYYEAGELVEFADFPRLARATQAFLARPAVARGMQVPRRPD